MAAEDLRIIIKASDEASAVLKGIGKEASGLGGIFGGVLKVGLLGAAAGVAALGTGLAASIVEAIGAEEATAKLAAVLEATGGISGVTMEQALGLAASFQKLTRFSDETVMSAQAVLLRFRSISKDVFPDATRVTLDLATAMGIDASSAATMLGKALETPGEGLLRLKQAGVAFDDEQTKMILKMAEAGDMAGAQALILKELEKSIGGAANAAGNTFAGQLDILKNAFSDSLEIIGGAFLPALTELVTSINANIMPAFREWAKLIAVGDWGAAIGQAWTKITEMATAIANELVRQWPAISAKLVEWAGKFWDWLTGTVIPAVAGKMGEFSQALVNWSTSDDGKSAMQQVGKNAGQAIVDGLKTLFTDPATGTVSGLSIVDMLQNAATNFRTTLATIGGTIVGGIVSGILQNFTDKATADKVGVSIGDMMTNLQSVIFNPMGTLAKYITDTLSNAIRTATTIKDALAGDFTDAWQAIQDQNWSQHGIDTATLLKSGLTSLGTAMRNAMPSALTDSWADINAQNWWLHGNDASTWFKNGLTSLGTAMRNALPDALKDAWADITNQKWNQHGIDTSTLFKNGLTSLGTAMRNAIPDALKDAWTDITNMNWWQKGSDVAKSFQDGLRAWWGNIVDALLGAVQDAIDRIKQILGIASPSKVMADIGAQMAAGLQTGFAQPMLSASTVVSQVLSPRMGGASLVGAGVGMGGGGFTFVYAPQISLATREEAEQTIAPMVVTAVLDAQRRGML